jgi:cytoskeletal protein CcmA (bactofilin family)
MFGKNTTANVNPVYNSLLEGTQIKGNIQSATDLRIDGELEGDLRCQGRVVIGPQGSVKGNIICKSGLIQGKVLGDLQVEVLLELKNTAQVQGNINSSKLVVEEGVVLQGHCKVQPK